MSIFHAGDKVQFDGKPCEATKVFKNGYIDITCWVQTFGMLKPQSMKFHVKQTSVQAA